MSRIALLLTQGVADWEYALIGGTAAPFFGLETRFFAPEAGKVTSMAGLTVQVPHGLEALPAWTPTVVAVMGGTIWESASAPDLGDFLRTLRADGVTVAGICGATLALARAGLLESIPHTSNDAGYLTTHVSDYRGGAHYRDQAAAVSADGVITASGLAPVSFAAEVFAAAGLPPDQVTQFRSMLAAEHG